MAKLFASIKKRWLAKRQLPLSVSKKRANSRRAKHYSLWLTHSRQLLVTIRTFRTSRQNRAKTFRQTVLKLRYLPGRTQEIAIRQKKAGVRKSRQNLTLSLRRLASSVVVVAGIAGTAYFGMQLTVSAEAPPAPTSYALPLPTESEEPEPVESQGLRASVPLNLTISSIGVSADIITVGKNVDGSMETPPLDSHKAGWYKHGPTPGEIGPAIIVGHVDNVNGPSVFWRLGELKRGDKVKVTREDGETVTFKVNRIEQFDQDKFPTDEVYGNIDHAGLRLITCGGTFDASTGRYTHNTVVFASLVE